MHLKICSFLKYITILKLQKEGKMVKNTLLCLFLISVKDFKIAEFTENNQAPVKSSLLNSEQSANSRVRRGQPYTDT